LSPLVAAELEVVDGTHLRAVDAEGSKVPVDREVVDRAELLCGDPALVELAPKLAPARGPELVSTRGLPVLLKLLGVKAPQVGVEVPIEVGVQREPPAAQVGKQ